MSEVINFEDLCSNIRGGARRAPSDKATFATGMTNEKGSKKPSYNLRVELPVKALKEARFYAGDKVSISYMPKNRKLSIVRNSQGRWSLAGKKGKRLSVKVGYQGGMPTTAETIHCEVGVTESGIDLLLPDSVSHTENLRAKSEMGL